ncbi:MAG TPA: DedA family protein [Candidatus Dormibacteraeota bacterium]|nr:DedA family protein [Candidatus Dormibacteraeota bacterium]
MRLSPGGAPRRAAAAIAARRRRWTIGAFGAAIVALLVFAILEGDLPDLVQDGAYVVGHLLRQFGLLAAFALLYAEESGVPMPMPGDVFVMYVGHHAAHGLLTALAAWLALIAVVVLGASNLYWISQRWGRSIVEHRLASVLHLTPARIDRAERWFARYGVWTLVFGRHIPGLRVPLTVAAGIFRVRYRVFIASVAISTAVWAGFFLMLGAVFGGRIGHLLALHREGYVILPAVIVLAFGVYLAILLRRTAKIETAQ